MAISGVNSWGPYTANDGSDAEFPNYVEPIGTAVTNTPAAATPPQSPSGTIAAEPNRGELITESYLANVLGVESFQEGTVTLTSAPTIAGVAAADLGWTNMVQEFNPQPGYGSSGTKFS
jgi:hypothetical protein